MIGGFQERPLNECADAVKLVEVTHKDAISAKAGNNASSWKVEKVYSQVVAGTNWWYHVVDNNGNKWSACIYEPLPHTGNAAEVKLVENGHNDAKNPN